MRCSLEEIPVTEGARSRLVDEYDDAQDRGEVAKAVKDKSKIPNENFATSADIGLTHKDIHEARLIRDARQGKHSGVECFTTTTDTCGTACICFPFDLALENFGRHIGHSDSGDLLALGEFVLLTAKILVCATKNQFA